MTCTTAHSTCLIDVWFWSKDTCINVWENEHSTLQPFILLFTDLFYPCHLRTQNALQSYIHSDSHQLFSAWNPCQEIFKLSHGLSPSQAQEYPSWLHRPALQTEQGRGQRKGIGTGQVQNRETALQLERPAQMFHHTAAIPSQIHPIDPLLKTDDPFWKQCLKTTIIENSSWWLVLHCTCQIDLTVLASAEAITPTSCSSALRKANKLHKQPCKQTHTDSAT